MQFLLSKNLRRLSKLYAKTIVNELPDLQSEYGIEILLLLSSRMEPFTQQELAYCLYVDKSQITLMIEGLTRLQHIYIEINPRDRRKHLVFLTDKGKQFVPKIQHAIDKVNTSINKQLNKAHLNRFYSTLLEMELNLSD